MEGHGTLIRAFNKVLVSLIYRREIIGIHNVPRSGGALLIINHISLSDPSVVLASVPRPVRFLMYRPYYENRWISPLAKGTDAIPVSTEDPPRKIMQSLLTAREALQNGDCVGIFAEGELTRIGNLLPFNKGFEKIMQGVTAPIIPVHIDSMWGSFFSHRNGRPLRKFPKSFPYEISVTFGEPLHSSTKAPEVRKAVMELGRDTFSKRTFGEGSLGKTFVSTAKKRFFAPSLADSEHAPLSYGTLLGSAVLAAWKMKKIADAESMVGVLAPASLGAAIINLGLTLRGAIPVNLNFTASKDALASAISQCKMQRVIAPKALAGSISDATTVDPSEVLSQNKFLIFIASLISILIPWFILRRLLGFADPKPEDTATVLFSSGSTGTPKGVMLSHKNILSNITGLSEVFQLRRSDCILGVLPFFHSFGFTGTLWLPLMTGVRAAYHKNPLESEPIADLALKLKGSILLATPTFLTMYLRKIPKEAFSSLRHVVVGAEKLSERLRSSFKEKFNIEPMEGYGCTELSPVAMLNVKDFADTAVTQKGNKPGSVGHPLPGIAARIVDPETFEPLPIDSEGLLLISGSNVMKGYLGDPEKTSSVIKKGWYVTGDIAKMDEDGFITITDRLSRFSKIGGEMVPHVRVEEELQSILEREDRVCVVTALSHATKGEQLVVLHTVELDPKEITKKLSEKGLPNLWIPKRENFFLIEQIPLLGTGKVDLKKIKEIATQEVGTPLE